MSLFTHFSNSSLHRHTKKPAGYGKRSLSGSEAAPYQLLVDHLAAASDIKEILSNVSTIECPPKPSDYTCPKILTKEELHKNICQYETVLTSELNLVPETEKAQTRCGAMKLMKQDAKNEDERIELPEKLAVVFGKDCKLPELFESKKDGVSEFFVLIKTSVPHGTKFILADGTNIDLVSTQGISKEEISGLLKKCSATASQ